MQKTFLELGIPHVPLSKEHLDLSNPDMQAQLHNHLETCEEVPDLWASIPCTSGSPWQRVNRSKGGTRFARTHAQQVRESRRLFAEFTRSSEIVLARGGTVTFEWPKGCESWSRHDVKSFFDAHPEFQLVEFDGCAVGVQSTKGRPIKKTWRLMATSQRIVDAFSQHKCTHSPHERDHAVGSQTAKTAFYPPQMVCEIARALYPQKVNLAPAPAMPCVVPAAASQAREEEHRVKEQSLKHISALAGADAIALAVETDEVADQMAECLMDLETLVRAAFDIPKVLNITAGYMQW